MHKIRTAAYASAWKGPTKSKPETAGIKSKTSNLPTPSSQAHSHTSSSLAAQPKTSNAPKTLFQTWHLEHAVTLSQDDLDLEYRDILRDIFGCKDTIDSQLQVLTAHMYLSMRNSAVTKEQLSNYFKRFYQIDCPGHKILTIRRHILKLDDIKDYEELRLYLNTLRTLEVGSDRDKRIQRLRSRKDFEKATPCKALESAVEVYNFYWRSLSDVEQAASICEWEGRPYMSSKSRSFQPIPTFLSEKLVPGVFKIDGLNAMEESFLFHVTGLKTLPLELRSVVLAHVFRCAYDSLDLTPRQLFRFLKKYYGIEIKYCTLIVRSWQFVCVAENCNAQNKLADYLEFYSRGFNKSLTRKGRVEVWYKVVKALNYEWEKLGTIRRMTSVQEWRMAFDSETS